MTEVVLTQEQWTVLTQGLSDLVSLSGRLEVLVFVLVALAVLWLALRVVFKW